MHPIGLIEYIIASIPLIVILLLIFVLKGKWRKGGIILAGVYAVVCILFFSLRPYYIDHQIAERVDKLNVYLEEKYPDETWIFWTVPHREDDYKTMNPLIIEVTFENEPTVHYEFWVKGDEIKPLSYWSDNDSATEFEHWE